MRLFGLISFQTRHFEAFSKNRPTAVRCWLTTTYRLPVVDVTTTQYKHNTFVYVLRALKKTFTRGTQKIMTISLIIHEFYYKVNSHADQVDNARECTSSHVRVNDWHRKSVVGFWLVDNSTRRWRHTVERRTKKPAQIVFSTVHLLPHISPVSVLRLSSGKK